MPHSHGGHGACSPGSTDLPGTHTVTEMDFIVSGESPLAKDCDGAQGDAPRGVFTCSQDGAWQSPQRQRSLLEALENPNPPLIQELTGTGARLGNGQEG